MNANQAQRTMVLADFHPTVHCGPSAPGTSLALPVDHYNFVTSPGPIKVRSTFCTRKEYQVSQTIFCRLINMTHGLSLILKSSYLLGMFLGDYFGHVLNPSFKLSQTQGAFHIPSIKDKLSHFHVLESVISVVRQ